MNKIDRKCVHKTVIHRNLLSPLLQLATSTAALKAKQHAKQVKITVGFIFQDMRSTASTECSRFEIGE